MGNPHRVMASEANALDLLFGGLTTTSGINEKKQVCVAATAQIILID